MYLVVLLFVILTLPVHIVCNDDSVVLDRTTPIIRRITQYCHNPFFKVVDTFYKKNLGE